MRIRLQSGREWVIVCAACGTNPGGRAPPTQPPGFGSSTRFMNPLDLSRNLRTLAGCEAPADGALEVPGRARRRRGAGRLAGDDARNPALDFDLAARGVRPIHRGLAGRVEPTVRTCARAEAPAEQQLSRRRA